MYFKVDFDFEAVKKLKVTATIENHVAVNKGKYISE